VGAVLVVAVKRSLGVAVATGVEVAFGVSAAARAAAWGKLR
jgi:hypothetical protein